MRDCHWLVLHPFNHFFWPERTYWIGLPACLLIMYLLSCIHSACSSLFTIRVLLKARRRTARTTSCHTRLAKQVQPNFHHASSLLDSCQHKQWPCLIFMLLEGVLVVSYENETWRRCPVRLALEGCLTEAAPVCLCSASCSTNRTGGFYECKRKTRARARSSVEKGGCLLWQGSGFRLDVSNVRLFNRGEMGSLDVNMANAKRYQGYFDIIWPYLGGNSWHVVYVSSIGSLKTRLGDAGLHLQEPAEASRHFNPAFQQGFWVPFWHQQPCIEASSQNPLNKKLIHACGLRICAPGFLSNHIIL